MSRIIIFLFISIFFLLVKSEYTLVLQSTSEENQPQTFTSDKTNYYQEFVLKKEAGLFLLFVATSLLLIGWRLFRGNL